MRLIKRVHRHRNRAAWVIAGALVLSTALAACSSSSAGSATAASPGSSGAVALKHGGTLRVGIVSLSTADALDPAMASTEGGYSTGEVLENLGRAGQ